LDTWAAKRVRGKKGKGTNDVKRKETIGLDFDSLADGGGGKEKKKKWRLFSGGSRGGVKFRWKGQGKVDLPGVWGRGRFLIEKVRKKTERENSKPPPQLQKKGT